HMDILEKMQLEMQNGISKEDFINLVETERLKIPKDVYLGGVRQVDDFIKSNKRCLFLAKGPSLCHAETMCKYGHIATVNEACLKISGTIDYAFFFDSSTLLNSKAAWDRIRLFVLPAMVFGRQINDAPIKINEIDGFPIERVVTFYKDQQDWDNKAEIVASIQSEELLTTDTAVMGLHFLTMCGYQEFMLLGHDGGIGYSDVPNVIKDRDMSKFRETIEFVAGEICKKYNTSISFYDGKVISSKYRLNRKYTRSI
ncbi:MAG TPA: hypothetical protein VKR58_09915, partial [Aquella sp.]|nr:hypothetical protein [Aquella sp.]